ncbi:hypothetical protein HPB51_020613 [Rhipicephalus microplus]|uniref:THAP-type domain-containing protein n=1 Tax=Rhipicephalus microplus TaxID=6941 RepID=A0A9J6DJ25_RHIMP|nr:hypothetical protein HPB51_020613 [Rhipicephalus microplus]
MTKVRLRHCYAPGCRTGYAGVKADRKLSLFSVPKDERRRKIWERNLHRSDKALEENCAVCELQFEDRYILRDYVHIIDGKEVRIARGVPARTPDAVPTILPNAPKYLSTKLPPKRTPRKREAPTVPGPQNSKKACTSTPVDDDFESQDDVHDVSTASLKLENLRELRTPSKYWAVHQFPGYEGTVYTLSQLDTCSGTVTSERAVLCHMSVIEQASYKTFLNGKPVSEGLVRTVLQAEEALLQASKFLKCPGALSTSSISEEDLTTKLLGQTTVLDGSFYNKKCAGTTAAEGNLESKSHAK